MKMILLFSLAALLVAHVAWHARLRRLFAWLGARPVGLFPVWKQVKARLEELSRRERLPAPGLWILPEFSPNALVVRSLRGDAHVALSEGLLRSLSAAELDALLVLCLAHAYSPRRRFQTFLSQQLLPLARIIQGYPAALQLLLAPTLTFLLRLANPQSAVLASDSRLRSREEALVVAAALQKIAVLGRKIPLKQWNFALDPLFIVSPLTLDGAPFWLFLSQPPVELRRERLLGGAAPCESAPSLP